MIILDTDHCIDILRGRQEVIVARRSVYEEVATTIITACELYFGAAKSAKPLENKRAVDAFAAGVFSRGDATLFRPLLEQSVFGRAVRCVRRRRARGCPRTRRT